MPMVWERIKFRVVLWRHRLNRRRAERARRRSHYSLDRDDELSGDEIGQLVGGERARWIALAGNPIELAELLRTGSDDDRWKALAIQRLAEIPDSCHAELQAILASNAGERLRFAALVGLFSLGSGLRGRFDLGRQALRLYDDLESPPGRQAALLFVGNVIGNPAAGLVGSAEEVAALRAAVEVAAKSV